MRLSPSLMAGRNILLALLLSLPLTIAFGVLYTFYPLILAALSLIWRGIASNGPQTGGIGAVAGGVSVSFLKMLVISDAIIFLLIFGLLQTTSIKR
jgi:hypothetical protein